METSEDQPGRALAAINRAYLGPPLIWLTRFFQWLAGWRWGFPALAVVVLAEWSALYALGVLD